MLRSDQTTDYVESKYETLFMVILRINTRLWRNKGGRIFVLLFLSLIVR